MIFFLPRANDICFLGCLRSLKREGIYVISGLYNWKKNQKFLSNYSKYLKKKITISNPAKKEDKFIKEIKKLHSKSTKKSEKFFYLPTSDTNMMVAIKNWKKISKSFFILGNKSFSKPNKNVYCKLSMFRLFEKNNINTPHTDKFSEQNFLQIQKKYKYAIVKPSIKDFAQTFYKINIFKAVTLKTLKEFKIFKKKNKILIKDLILQEKIKFNKINHELPLYLYVNKKHEIVFSVCGVKHFIYPKKYGSAGILGITENKDLLDLAKKIVKVIKWRGILMIEFMYCSKSKKWYVIEMNGRPWLMIDFFRRLGFSFLKLLAYDFSNFSLDETLKHFELKKKEAIKKKSLHVDLSILQNAIDDDSQNFAKIKKILEKSKNISVSSLDNDDIKPFYQEIKFVENKLVKLVS